MKPLCIYHASCVDGFGAAWVVREHFGGVVDFYAARYNEIPPEVRGRHVIIVDFSYKRDVLVSMAIAAKSILVLDHHLSAMKDLEGLDHAATSWTKHMNRVEFDETQGSDSLYVLFDMSRSGAGLTWDFFFGPVPRPMLINHIEDRDLWRFKMPDTRSVSASLFSYPYDFSVWDRLMDQTHYQIMAHEGVAILRKEQKDLKEILAIATQEFTIQGHRIPAANVPYMMASEAGNELCKGRPFAATYYVDKDGLYNFSLRSSEDGLDVSEIAKMYGGGGHKHAAGFKVPGTIARMFELEDSHG